MRQVWVLSADLAGMPHDRVRLRTDNVLAVLALEVCAGLKEAVDRLSDVARTVIATAVPRSEPVMARYDEPVRCEICN
jgi:hypothetical protein